MSSNTFWISANFSTELSTDVLVVLVRLAKASFITIDAVLAEISPLVNTSCKEPYSCIKRCIYIPCPSAALVTAFSKSDTSIPASSIKSVSLLQLEETNASSSMSFLTFPPSANNSYKELANFVHTAVASSAFPNIFSKVFIQPVLTASFTASIASAKVLAF